MLSIRLKNFRGFHDTGLVEIRPITVFVGRNGSGKSSVTRFLPLLRQSVEVRAAAPLVWFGEYVDFGSMADVKCRFTPEENIKISITLSMKDVDPYSIYGMHSLAVRRVDQVSITTDLVDVAGKTKVQQCLIELDDDTIEVAISPQTDHLDGLSINGLDVSEYIERENPQVQISSLVPVVRPTIVQRQRDTRRVSPFRFRSIHHNIEQIYKEQLHGNVSEDTISEIAQNIHYSPEPGFLASLRNYPTGMESWARFVQSLGGGAKRYEKIRTELRSLHLLAELPEILLDLDSKLSGAFERITYIGPARATGERYYRIQELAVDQIDPEGKNLAAFLSALSDRELRRFSGWIERFLGYEVKSERSAGHISIFLKEVGSSQAFNIADMGFGFSQVLPVLAQVWMGRFRLSRRGKRIIAIEQPELHLHPALQASLGRAFARAIYSNPGRERRATGLHLLLETHSEQLINELAELVQRGRLDSEDVAIYLFERSAELGVSTVRRAKISPEGVLRDWPFGFFTA